MTLTRIAFRTGLVLLILVTGVVAAIAGFGERLLAAAIESGGPALVGREVRVGDVSIDWGRRTTLTATDLTVADERWSGGDGPMLRVHRAELTIDLLDALLLRLSPARLGLQQPVLHLARHEDGRWNLPQGGSGGGTSGNGVLSRLAALRELKVEGGKLTVDDLASPGTEGRITAASLRIPGAGDGIEFDGTASWEGGPPIALSGQTGPLEQNPIIQARILRR